MSRWLLRQAFSLGVVAVACCCIGVSGAKDKEKYLMEHAGHVNSVCFSPDGRFALSGSNDNTMKLWELSQGAEVRTFAGHTFWVTSVCFSPDGRQALSGSGDQSARLWDVSTGAEIRKFTGHAKSLSSVAFSPDGRQIATGSYDKTVKLWDVEEGKEIRTFSGHEGPVFSVCFSPDGRHVLSGGKDCAIILWDAATGQEVRRFTGHAGKVYSVAFSRDGSSIVSASADKTVKIWETATGKERRTIQYRNPDNPYPGAATFNQECSSACFSPDGRLVLVGSWDGTAKLWNLEALAQSQQGSEENGRGKLLEILGGSFWRIDPPVTCVCFSPDGRFVLFGSMKNTLRLFQTAKAKEIKNVSDYAKVP